ncbi:MAG: DUF4249 domain-containing protein [Chryseolinea sp.]
MMKHSAMYSRAVISFLILLISACLEPYSPNIKDAAIDIFVVDGFLDTSDGSATVTLSKATNMIDGTPTPRVQNASVTIEGNDGSSYAVPEDTAGVYVASGIPVNASTQYRVHIVANGSEYASDYVQDKPTPAIDSVTRAFAENGTTVYVNTHDASGLTQYYRWEYVETYEYTSRVNSEYKVVNGVPISRNADESIYRCYRTVNSTKIYVTSTIQLEADVVRHFPLINIAPESNKLYIRYSAQVKQRAINKAEYTFLDQLKKTTEGIGTLFDPQPSQVLGNVHNLSGGAAPLGYFSAGSTTSQRIFIIYNDLPKYLKGQNLALCAVDTICIIPKIFKTCFKNADQITDSDIIAGGIYSVSGALLGYTHTYPGCADCRLAGGVVKKPEFWP